eukprot:XP_001689577.1 high mobility group protein [Chlamydomonas reinhardtii]
MFAGALWTCAVRAMAEGVQAFGEIWLGGRGGVASGVLKLAPTGLTWRRKQGSKLVEVKKDEIEALSWTKVPRGCQLSVRRKGGPTVNFLGFRDKDLDTLQQYSRTTLALPEGVSEGALSTSGHNWGGVQLRGASLAFLVGGKDDVMLELHVDDTGGEVAEDMLTELAFYVPPGNEDFPAQGEEVPPAKVMLDALLPHADTEAAAADEPVCVFSEVGIVAPRGRFEVEMHLGYLQLGGQSQDFKVRYASIQRIFILPKHNTPHTLVVISLDPPIRKGQTYYAHLLCQFPTDDDISVELDITEEALAAKNEKNGGKLSADMTGPVWEVFAKLLRGLSGARITRPGHFKNAAGDGVNIQRSEWGNLFEFIRAKKIPIENFGSAQHGPGGAKPGMEDDDMDPGVAVDAIKKKRKKGDADGGEEGEAAAAPPPKKKPAKEKPATSPSGADAAPGSGGKGKKGKKAAATEEGEGGAKPKKERKKKDPNAPKKNLSAFMYFSNSNRDKVKAENPGIAFGEVGKLLGERWKAMSAEEKAPYDEMAAKDKAGADSTTAVRT